MSDGLTGTADPTVLVIENNPADVRLVKQGVTEADADIDLQVINSGQKAVDSLTAIDADAPGEHPDLVLLDLNLPGKSGHDILGVVRNETAFPAVPVVVISSSENSDDIDRVYDASANAYVTKPVDPDEYIDMVDAVIDFWLSNTTYSQ